MVAAGVGIKPPLISRKTPRRTERFAHPRQAALKPGAVVRGLDGAFGQFGDALHLFTEHATPARAGALDWPMVCSAPSIRSMMATLPLALSRI